MYTLYISERTYSFLFSSDGIIINAQLFLFNLSALFWCSSSTLGHVGSSKERQTLFRRSTATGPGGSSPARSLGNIDDSSRIRNNRSPLVAFPRRQHDRHFASSTGSRRPSPSFLTHLANVPPMDPLSHSLLSDLCLESSTFSPPLSLSLSVSSIPFVPYAGDHISPNAKEKPPSRSINSKQDPRRTGNRLENSFVGKTLAMKSVLNFRFRG